MFRNMNYPSLMAPRYLSFLPAKYSNWRILIGESVGDFTGTFTKILLFIRIHPVFSVFFLLVFEPSRLENGPFLRRCAGIDINYILML